MRLVEPTLMDLLGLTYAAREDERMQYESLVGPWDYEDVAAGFYAKSGVKFGLQNDEGIVVCAGGWEMMIPGVWQSWMVGTDDFWKKYWRSITKQTKFIADEMLKDPAVRRLQTGGLACREKACEWYVRGLKMEFESTARNFGFNGEDMNIYVRLKELDNG